MNDFSIFIDKIRFTRPKNTTKMQKKLFSSHKTNVPSIRIQVRYDLLCEEEQFIRAKSVRKSEKDPVSAESKPTESKDSDESKPTEGKAGFLLVVSIPCF